VTRREAERLKAVLALDGILGRVVDTAVGSRRYRVDISAQGGHSWQDFGSTSAVQLLGELINRVYEMKVPTRAKTTFNIGRVEGGTSVNTIPDSAMFLVDLRSVDPDCLTAIEGAFLDIVKNHGHLPGYSLKTTLVGDRPAGTLAGNAVLAGMVREALEAMGLDCTISASSTDANFPTSLGIPSVTVGLFSGYNAHRPSEYLELKSIGPGMELLLRVWLSIDLQ
jgi:di/tripeptidase